MKRFERDDPEPEFKWYDAFNTQVPFSNPNGPSTPQFFALDNIAQGVTQSERVGDKIKASSIFGRMFFAETGTPLQDIVVRMLLFIWKAPSAPTLAQIFQDPTQVTSPLNRDFSMNIAILKDKSWALNNGHNQVQHYKFHKKLWYTNQYQSDTSNLTSRNGLYVVFNTNFPISANAPTLDYYFRLTYQDA